MDKEIKAILIVILFCLSIIFLWGCLVIWKSSVSCNEKWSESVYQHKLEPISSCMVKTDKGWIPSFNECVKDK